VDVGVNVNFDGDGDVDLDTHVDDFLATFSSDRRLLRMLSFQRLDVYQRAIQYLAHASEIAEDLPRGHSERADQLVRAAESVVRNIAEGAGRWSDADCAKHYKIARGEAMKLVAPERYEVGITLLEAIVAMLTKMF